MTLPLPRMHPSGAAVAEARECEWWPSAEECERSRAHAEQHGESVVPGINSDWIDRARRFLVDYSEPLRTSAQNVTFRTHGHISAALEQIRDDRIILDSLADVSGDVRAGVEIKHRDVLAAVALLSKVDTTGDGTSFRPGALESVD